MRFDVWFMLLKSAGKVLNALNATDFEEGIFIQPAFVYALRYLFRDELLFIFHMM